jgi:hypothetical protein
MVLRFLITQRHIVHKCMFLVAGYVSYLVINEQFEGNRMISLMKRESVYNLP